jgi:predicted permease
MPNTPTAPFTFLMDGSWKRTSQAQMLRDLILDLRFAARSFLRNPGFSAVVVLTLALGIGANTAVFGLMDAVMLRMMPIREPGQLVFVNIAGTQGLNGGPPYPAFELLREKAKSFESIAAFSGSNIELTINGVREQTQGVWVSGNFYSVLGAQPLLGRPLLASDDEIVGQGGSAGPVAVISESYWQRRFSGDRAIIGRPVRMSETSVTIVGVMPSEAMTLESGRSIDIAVPMMLSNPGMLRDKGSFWLYVVGRLPRGVQEEKARAEADALFQAYMADVKLPEGIRSLEFDHVELTAAGRGMDNLRRQFATPLSVLMVLSGLVLLAACVNVANLLLARASGRQKEIAVQVAMGAGRGRLFRQALTEALVFVAAGSVSGLVLARWIQTLLSAFFLEGNNQIILNLSLNLRSITFTITVSALACLIFALLPVLRATRVDAAEALQSSSRSVSGNRFVLRSGRAFVVLQVALSTVLLIGAGLFIQTLRQLQSVDLGFTHDGILTMEIAPEQQLFGKPEWFAVQSTILERIDRVPGVRSVSWSTMSPFSGRDRGVLVDFPKFVPTSVTDRVVHLVSVSPEYFRTFEVPVQLGRTFTSRDDENAAKVAILNETAARFYFGTSQPIGQTVKISSRPGGKSVSRPGSETYEVVGVVKDTLRESLRERPERFLYLPISQAIDPINRLALTVRFRSDSAGLAAQIRSEILGIDSTLLITNVATMDQQIQRSLIREKLVKMLSTVFGILALILACIGLYGILSCTAKRREWEFGVRIALGAKRPEIVWLIFREALALTAIGIVIGVPVALGLGRLTHSLLYGVEASDSMTVLVAVAAQLGVATIAGLVPAHRAGRSDPLTAIRSE